MTKKFRGTKPGPRNIPKLPKNAALPTNSDKAASRKSGNGFVKDLLALNPAYLRMPRSFCAMMAR